MTDFNSQRQTTLAFIVTGVLLAGMLVLPLFDRPTWPFMHWDLYSTTNPEVPSVYDAYRVRVNTTPPTFIHPYDMYQSDDYTSIQGFANVMLQAAATGDNAPFAQLSRERLQQYLDVVGVGEYDATLQVCQLEPQTDRWGLVTHTQTCQDLKPLINESE